MTLKHDKLRIATINAWLSGQRFTYETSVAIINIDTMGDRYIKLALIGI